jgi:hypothetical protein
VCQRHVVALTCLVVAGGAATWWSGTTAGVAPAASLAPPANYPAVAARPEQAATESAGWQAAQRNRQLVQALQSALISPDPALHETALHRLLPELLTAEPSRLPEVLAGQPAGPARDEFQDELARQWILHDEPAARAWLDSLDADARAAGARAALRALSARDPARAVDLALEFGVGLDDGSLAHRMQTWAVEDPEAAQRWALTASADPRLDGLRARIATHVGTF